jgi:NAD(P)-dependent dehydrogenase (short-subunit alcohol dehydrogenase family)
MKDFKGKVAVVTGGAGGIGLGLAEKCAKEGMKVVLADIEAPALKEAEIKLISQGADVLAVRTDVSILEEVETLARKTLDVFGGVHLLFNNAGVQVGVQRSKMLWEETFNDWQWVVGVNLWGVVHGVKVFLPIMLRQKAPGHIVNTSSVGGLMSGSEVGTYKVTKAAVIMLSETLHLQLRQRQQPIGVTAACPGGVRSRLNDAERNRPAALKDPPDTSRLTPEQKTLRKFFEDMNETAMPPSKFAEMVFAAIRTDQLFLLSHPEMNERIRQRCEDLLKQRNPTAVGFE